MELKAKSKKKKVSPEEKNTIEEEKKLAVKTSRKAYFFVYMLIAILLLTVAVIKISGNELDEFLFKAVLVFCGILILWVELHRFRIRYEINQNALIRSVGILSKKTRMVDLVSISDADSDQSAWQRVLNYGNVNARMFSQDSALSIKNINNPQKFARFLQERINDKRAGE